MSTGSEVPDRRAWVAGLFASPDPDERQVYRAGPGSDTQAALWIAELFETAGEALADRADDAIASGLEFLWDGNRSNYASGALAPDVAVDVRVRYVRSISRLFDRVFLSRTRSRGLLCELASPTRLERLCVGVWDMTRAVTYLSPAYGDVDPRTVDALWDTIERMLHLPSDLCAESAIHGLWRHAYVPSFPERLGGLIAGLPRRPEVLPAELGRRIVALVALVR